MNQSSLGVGDGLVVAIPGNHNANAEECITKIQNRAESLELELV